LDVDRGRKGKKLGINEEKKKEVSNCLDSPFYGVYRSRGGEKGEKQAKPMWSGVKKIKSKADVYNYYRGNSSFKSRGREGLWGGE